MGRQYVRPRRPEGEAYGVRHAPKRQKLDAYLVTHLDGSREILIEGEPIMGLAELAEALDVRVQNVDHVPGVPEPAGKVRATRLWLGHEINAFQTMRLARKAASGR